MKRIAVCLLVLLCVTCMPKAAIGEMAYWRLCDEAGEALTDICEPPSVGDKYISAENVMYRIIRIEGQIAYVRSEGMIELPYVGVAADNALAVSGRIKTIAMYCTHSDESYEPSDGYYSTRERGSIYQIAAALAEGLRHKNVEVYLADTLHHPHDAGAYRRSRQTAVQLLKEAFPDCLIDIHRDGIPDPASYQVTIAGKPASKIRLLVGRGNQNADINKDFALRIKAVADLVYPGLIKDIYLGRGTFNQDLLPHSILFECGTYTLEKERVLTSMPLMADVLNRALYGGVSGSADSNGRNVGTRIESNDSVQTETSSLQNTIHEKTGSGVSFLLVLLVISVASTAVLSAGSLKVGMRKTKRNLSEMTGGLIGTKPNPDEDHEHS